MTEQEMACDANATAKSSDPVALMAFRRDTVTTPEGFAFIYGYSIVHESGHRVVVGLTANQKLAEAVPLECVGYIVDISNPTLCRQLFLDLSGWRSGDPHRVIWGIDDWDDRPPLLKPVTDIVFMEGSEEPIIASGGGFDGRGGTFLPANPSGPSNPSTLVSSFGPFFSFSCPDRTVDVDHPATWSSLSEEERRFIESERARFEREKVESCSRRMTADLQKLARVGWSLQMKPEPEGERKV